jgi:TetR/AcrR family transcriptional regulator, transcriptional repressor for nem operon
LTLKKIHIFANQTVGINMNESKEYIIEVALKLFLQKSFKEVTMKEIVENTGLSKGAFYHYFTSKEQLFIEVLDQFFSIAVHNYESYSKESFYQFYHDYAGKIHDLNVQLLKKFHMDSSDETFNMNYFMLIFDALNMFPDYRDRMDVAMSQEIEIWANAIKNARARGEIKTDMTDEELAKTFMYLSDGISIHMVMRKHKISEMVNTFLNLWDKIYKLIKT